MRRLYENRDLSKEELALVASNILASVGEESNASKNIINLKEDNIPVRKSKKGVKIKSLDNVVNVAAVDNEYGIEFNTDGLTVIYGDNSAGKSSYAKVLKQACRAVDDNTIIHPNIYQDSKLIGSARIQITDESDNTHTIYREMNSSPDPQLGHVSIYDSKCGQVYAETENSVVFIPSELQIFNLLAKYQNILKGDLLKEKDSLIAELPKIPSFKDGTKIKKFVESISSKTTHQDINDTCYFNESDKKRLDQVHEDLAFLLQSNPEKSIKELESKINEVKNLSARIKKTINLLDNTKIDKFIKDHDIYLDLKETLRVATNQAFNQQPLNHVGSNPWMNLWEASREYHDLVYKETNFPNTTVGARCLLCQQDLNESGKERLNNFEEFIQSRISKETEEMENKLINFIDSLKNMSIEKIKDASIRGYIQNEVPTLDLKIEEFINSVEQIIVNIGSSLNEESIEVPSLNDFPLQELNDWISSQVKELERKKEIAKSSEREQLFKEKSELESKQEATRVIRDLHTIVDIKLRAENYNQAVADLSTTNVTKKYNVLASSFITKNFKSQIAKELKLMRCDNVLFDIKSRGVKGQTTIKLTIDSNNSIDLTEVFSEGEQKALSLSFFLAEVSSLESKGGIILDDPVSSFDQGRREYVAQRLVEEAKNRQVIVFTHDIVFLHTLEKYSKISRITMKRNVVRRIGKNAGIISSDLPWVAQGVKKRVNYLKNELQSLKSKQKTYEQDKLFMEVKSWYSLLREGWERAVEELMFGGVIERFDPSVRTQSLKNAKINDELIRIVEEGMTKSSTMVHDESPAIGRLTPSIEEMEEDISNLEKFRKEFT